MYLACRAEWNDALAGKRRVRELFLAAPPPLGNDPAPIFNGGVEHPELGQVARRSRDGPREPRV